MKIQNPSPIPELTSPLAEMFLDLHATLNAFTAEAAELHKAVAVTDAASRALLTALSRITAYSDQLQMVVSLMGEDVRLTEEIGMGPTPKFDSAEHENCFYEWLRTSRKGGVTVN